MFWCWQIYINSELSHNMETCGFSFGVEWGSFGFCAGHVSMKELRRMTTWINSELDRIEASGEDELEIINKFRLRLNEPPLDEIPTYIK